MITKLKQQFLNLKFQRKIIGISVIISLIPISLLGVFSYTKVRSLLIDREKIRPSGNPPSGSDTVRP